MCVDLNENKNLTLPKNSSDNKRRPDAGDPNKRKLTVLLAADNIDDESQVDLAVHGELAGKIVEKIFEQVNFEFSLRLSEIIKKLTN